MTMSWPLTLTSHVVYIVNQFMIAPKHFLHLAVQRIPRYLHGSMGCGLFHLNLLYNSLLNLMLNGPSVSRHVNLF